MASDNPSLSEQSPQLINVSIVPNGEYGSEKLVKHAAILMLTWVQGQRL